MVLGIILGFWEQPVEIKIKFNPTGFYEPVWSCQTPSDIAMLYVGSIHRSLCYGVFLKCQSLLGKADCRKKLMHRRRWYMLPFWGKGHEAIERGEQFPLKIWEKVSKRTIFGPDCKWRSGYWQKDMYCEGKDFSLWERHTQMQRQGNGFQEQVSSLFWIQYRFIKVH